MYIQLGQVYWFLKRTTTYFECTYNCANSLTHTSNSPSTDIFSECNILCLYIGTISLFLESLVHSINDRCDSGFLKKCWQKQSLKTFSFLTKNIVRIWMDRIGDFQLMLKYKYFLDQIMICFSWQSLFSKYFCRHLAYSKNQSHCQNVRHG